MLLRREVRQHLLANGGCDVVSAQTSRATSRAFRAGAACFGYASAGAPMLQVGKAAGNGGGRLAFILFVSFTNKHDHIGCAAQHDGAGLAAHAVRSGFTPGRALRPKVKVLPEHARGHNRSLVLQTLYRSGERSRADIARETGLTRVTISDLVAELLAEGLVVELGPAGVGASRQARGTPRHQPHRLPDRRHRPERACHFPWRRARPRRHHPRNAPISHSKGRPARGDHEGRGARRPAPRTQPPLRSSASASARPASSTSPEPYSRRRTSGGWTRPSRQPCTSAPGIRWSSRTTRTSPCSPSTVTETPQAT